MTDVMSTRALFSLPPKLAIVLSVLITFPSLGRAQNVSGFIHGQIQNFKQTSSAVPVVNATAPFQFGSLITMGTATINGATLTFTGTASPKTYTPDGVGNF